MAQSYSATKVKTVVIDLGATGHLSRPDDAFELTHEISNKIVVLANEFEARVMVKVL